MGALEAEKQKAYFRTKGVDEWQVGELQSSDAKQAKILAGGKEVVVPAADWCVYSEKAAKGIDNMTDLDSLNEASILQNVRTRFQSGKPYTLVGNILVSVNPFKALDIYGLDEVKKYATAAAGAGTVSAPHIYQTAAAAYSAMRSTGASQSVVISGESGAGKTEATKYILKYLTSVSDKSTLMNSTATNANGTPKKAAFEAAASTFNGGPPEGVEDEGGMRIEQKILDSNPVLEAFGNAKTVRNNNSSRFGKYFEAEFDTSGRIVGGSMTTYLLEKSRVVSPGPGERNYHVFYQLCCGCSPEERKTYKAAAVSTFAYLNSPGSEATIAGVDDAAEFAELKRALSSVGISSDEQRALFSIVSAVLHLGNVKFKPKQGMDEAAEVATPDAIEAAASLLKCPKQKLQDALEYRTMTSPSKRNSVYVIPCNVPGAEEARDSLAKALYAKVFDWLVRRVSDNMVSTSKVASRIGVLDIFGFECFDKNSLEQLFINFANEKLHNEFTKTVFAQEQEEYKKQGVPIDDISFKDNQPCLDYIEGRGASVFASLGEQCSMRQGTDQKFVDAVHGNLSKSAAYLRPNPKAGPCSIGVKHFAGDVTYLANDFITKNKSALHNDLQEIFHQCDDEQLQMMFQDPSQADELAPPTKNGAKKGVQTISAFFQKQLAQLITALASTQQHYVRCIKSNMEKVPDKFVEKLTAAQLSYCGVLALTLIRKQGYGVRMDMTTFSKRFMLLTKDGIKAGARPESDSASDALEAGTRCQEILTESNLPKTQWLIGKSKVFIKDDNAMALLDKAVLDKIEKVVAKPITRVQARFRGYMARKQSGFLRRKHLERELELERERLIKEGSKTGQSPMFLALQGAGGARPEDRERERRIKEMAARTELAPGQSPMFLALQSAGGADPTERERQRLILESRVKESKSPAFLAISGVGADNAKVELERKRLMKDAKERGAEKSPAFKALTAASGGASVDAKLADAQRSLRKYEAAKGEIDTLKQQLAAAMHRADRAEEGLSVMGAFLRETNQLQAFRDWRAKTK